MASFAYLYYKISAQDVVLMWKQTLLLLNDKDKATLFLYTLLLVFVNWGIEALKWRKLIHRLEAITFFESLKSVLAGVAVSLITPNRAGEFAGKIFYLRNANRADAMLLSIVGSLSQVLITFCIGLFAFYYYLIEFQAFSINPTLLFSFFASVVTMSMFLFFNVEYIAKHWKSWNFIQKIIPYHPEKFSLSKKEIGFLVLLSAFRFIVFSVQFYLLMKVFDLGLGVKESFVLIALYFFLISLIPTYALSELGVRGSVAISLFGPFGMSSAGVLTASLLLWMINIALPAVAGSFFVYQLRFFKTDDE
ncbi:MAG: flippase-like domain-containing protein [Bacteroidetes bacterium]|nr:flippase-like domain-containing protein [Bacteroidota bacterium]